MKMPRGGKRIGAGRPRKDLAKAASFEATQPTIDRPAIWIASIDAKKEASAWDRETVLKAGRWTMNNSGIGGRVVRGIARFSVGNGLVPQAQTSNGSFNKSAEQWFEDRYGNVPWAFDQSGQFNFYDVQAALVESMLVDGDVFAQLTRSESGLPMARFFDGAHVQSANKQQANLYDGVIVAPNTGRPIAYRVLADPSDTRQFVDVPAQDIVHIKRLQRIGYLRGVSWIGTAIAQIQDIREILANELSSVKLNTKIGLVIESDNAGTMGLGSQLATSTDSQGNEQKIEKIFQGVGSVQLRKGETLKAHAFDRPNNNLTQFLDYHIKEICYNVGTSPEVLLNHGNLGGTAIRAALQDADVFFSGVRNIIENQFCVRFWRYAIWHAIQKGELDDPGNDWFRVSFVSPPRVSVDFGRDSRALMELVRAGLLSRRKYHNMLGEDADTQMEDIIREAARRKKMVEQIATEEGVELTLQEIFPPAPGAAAPVEPDDDDEDDAPTPPRRQTVQEEE
jgi:lambda family phage portal protein